MSLLRCLVRFSVVLLVLLPKEDPTVEEEVKKISGANSACMIDFLQI